MKLLGVSIFIVSLVSFAAENPPKTGDLGTAPVMSGSSLIRDHAFVIKDEVVLVQATQKFVIPLKSITEVSYSVVNMISITVSPSSTEVGDSPTLVKTNDHFVGIVWAEKSQTRGAVLKMGVGDYWGFMNALQVAGIKAVNADVVSIVK